MKGSDIKEYILYGFLYVKFCAELNQGDEKQINGCLGLGGMEKIRNKMEICGAIKMFYTMIVLVATWLDMLSKLIKF